MDVARSRALALACSVALDDETDGDTIRRAQLFYDWMSGKFSVPIVYEIDEAEPPEPLNGDVLPFTSKGKNREH